MNSRRRLALAVPWLISALVATVPAAGDDPADAVPAPGENGKLVRVSEVHVVSSGVGPVVLLEVRGRIVPIFVDSTVAASIQAALAKEPLPRPMTHDLMQTVLRALGGEVTRATILLHEKIFYGELEISVNGESRVFDSRSSDAIALAVRAAAPLFVTRDVLDSVGKVEPGSDAREM